MLYVTSRALSDGRSSGINAAFGVSCGYLIFTGLVSIGLGSVFETYPLLFKILKFLGMAYLVYLAYRLHFADLAALAQVEPAVRPATNDVMLGFVTSVLNPKGLLFYFALLPQFYVGFTIPFWAYALIFGTVTSLLCFIIYAAVGLLASGRGREILVTHKNGLIISKLASATVFLVAVSLIFSNV